MRHAAIKRFNRSFLVSLFVLLTLAFIVGCGQPGALPSSPQPAPAPPGESLTQVPSGNVTPTLPTAENQTVLTSPTIPSLPPPPPAPAQRKAYSQQELEYFFEIAFGTEYGSSLPVLHKWARDIRIKVNGTPTSADLDTLNQVVAELNSLISGIAFSIVTDNPNIEYYFTTVSQFPLIEPNYVPGNKGFFYSWWDAAGAIFKERILIASEGVTQQERSHLIREELTNGLGLMKDSWQYPESIFYQGWTDVISYAPIDRAIIGLLYDSRLRPGMTKDQVNDVLSIQ